MDQMIIATKNKGKAREFEQLFSRFGITVKTLLDVPELPDVEETGSTFEENAILKAEAISKQLNAFVVADDSGLIIDALDGRPGVYSARYAGLQKDDEANIDKVLDEMQDVKDAERTARFYCALALARPGFKTLIVHGTSEGIILRERRGDAGFGYDPIFYVPDQGKTMAEMAADEKNGLSHRAAALRNLEPYIEKL